MNRKPEPPPDIAALGARVRELGAAVASGREAIEELKRPITFPGLWITSDGEEWTFHARIRRRQKAS